MAIDTRNLSGARASSAVRCIAKAEHEALGTPREDNLPGYLERAFKRGVNVGRAWANGMRAELLDAVVEADVPWGPPEYGWVGHVDLLDPKGMKVYEAYHAVGGAFREEKALQAAFYADELGTQWTAELAVIDTSDVSDEDGFAVQPYEINVDGLRERVRDIKRRVVAAVEAGSVNPADRVSDEETGPRHSECRSCPFQQACWEGWRPKPPEEVVGLEDDFNALAILKSDLHHANAKVASLEQLIRDKREPLREYLTPGVPVTSGDVTVTVTPVKGRTTIAVKDFEKAGNTIPAELAPFVRVSGGYERWDVSRGEAQR